MATWVRLLIQKQFELNGVSRMYYPGDFVEIGNQEARRMIVDGYAELPDGSYDAVDLTGCGMLVFGDEHEMRLDAFKGFEVQAAAARALPFAKTLLYETDLVLRPALVPVGFGLLQTWEVAAPVASYDVLAAHIGTLAERERTQTLIGDLRVPVYDTRLLFMRRCPATEQLVAAWDAERQPGANDQLAFLRALWTVKPLLLPLPTTWLN